MVIQLKDFSNHGIIIRPDDVLNDPNTSERITLDLRVGEYYKKPGDANLRQIRETLVLSPNDTYLIQTKEKLTTSHTVFGVVCPRSSLSAEGLMVASIKVDPSFSNNYLYITIFNTSKKRIRIKKDEAICSIFFQCLEHPVQQPIARNPPQSKPIMDNQSMEWFYRNWNNVLAILISLIGLGVSILTYASNLK